MSSARWWAGVIVSGLLVACGPAAGPASGPAAPGSPGDGAQSSAAAEQDSAPATLLRTEAAARLAQADEDLVALRAEIDATGRDEAAARALLERIAPRVERLLRRYREVAQGAPEPGQALTALLQMGTLTAALTEGLLALEGPARMHQSQRPAWLDEVTRLRVALDEQTLAFDVQALALAEVTGLSRPELAVVEARIQTVNARRARDEAPSYPSGGAPFSVDANVVGEVEPALRARFEEGEARRAALAEVRLEVGSEEALREGLGALVEQAGAAGDAYLEVSVSTQNPVFAVAAIVRGGDLLWSLAGRLEALTLPSALSGARRAALDAALSEMLGSLRARALDHYRLALQRAGQMGFENDFTARAQRQLEAHAPADPPAVEGTDL